MQYSEVQVNEINEMNETNEISETNEIAFGGPVRKSGGRSPAVRVGIVAGAAMLVVVGAVTAMGASPAPGGSTAPGARTPDGVRPGSGGPMGGFGMRGGDVGAVGFRDITITSIQGSDIALKTDDGWTRTITIAGTTTITKGGATIAVGKLAVGDQVRFREAKGSDGTYSVTAIVVVLPRVAGTVTAIDGQTLTVTQPGGTSATIHVDGATTYQVDRAAGKLADIKVGSFVVAEGARRADGSLDAANVRSGVRGHDGVRRPGFPGDHDGQPDPNASPAPSSNAG